MTRWKVVKSRLEQKSFESRVYTKAVIVVGKESLRLLETRWWQQKDLVVVRGVVQDHSETRSRLEGCRGRESTQRGMKKWKSKLCSSVYLPCWHGGGGASPTMCRRQLSVKDPMRENGRVDMRTWQSVPRDVQPLLLHRHVDVMRRLFPFFCAVKFLAFDCLTCSATLARTQRFDRWWRNSSRSCSPKVWLSSRVKSQNMGLFTCK